MSDRTWAVLEIFRSSPLEAGRLRSFAERVTEALGRATDPAHRDAIAAYAREHEESESLWRIR